MDKKYQGTISILFGCHSIIHSILVYLSWIKLYKRIPKFWQLICILLHDVGHFNKAYLHDKKQKKNHWILGAKIAGEIFGAKGYNLIAGHCIYSDKDKSLLYKADKYSWYIAPKWWIFINNIIEPQLKCGMSNIDAVNEFKEKVKKSINNNKFESTHNFYEERKHKQIKTRKR